MLKLFTQLIKLALILIIPFFFACSGNDAASTDNVVLIVNNFKMTKDEFQTECASEMEYNDIYKTSEKGIQDLLDCIIKKELLIQEAKRIGIDNDDKFIAAIEKYWEATLIKLLIERKNKEIQNTAMVSDKEIKKRYEAHKLKNKALPPLNMIEEEIATEILERKKTKTLENWIDALHKKANIETDDKFFTE